MVHQQRACCRLIIVGTELAAAAWVRFQDVSGIAVEVAHFADYSTDELGGVGWEVRELLGAFGLLHLPFVSMVGSGEGQ